MFYEVKILETAKEYDQRAMCWFRAYEESHEELDWQMVSEMRAKADGLLEAYAILTGRRIYLHQLDEELSNY